jgi:DNA-binding response OmpR family regulator
MVKKCLVLIIEDNEDFQHLYGMVAEQAGFDVERIYDGREALERLKREPIPTIVLLDSRLPVAEGDVILEAARSNEKWLHVPIYMLTADLRVSKKYKDFSPGAPRPDGVIEKGAESIHQLRKLFKQYQGKKDAE